MEVGEDKIYTILADACTDVTGKKLMTVDNRYVNSISGKILERTIGTVKVDNTTSQMLFDTVVNVLSRVSLDVTQCRAYGYDGAANMRDHKTGLAARVKELIPFAIFNHCCNHRLNVVVQKIGINVEDYQEIIDVTRLVFSEISLSPKRLG